MSVKESPSLAKKRELVSEIESNFKNAKSAIFVDYRGLTVAEASELRDKFRDAGVVYKVYKNTLVNIALKNCGIDVSDKLTGTLAVAFSNNDEITAAKLITAAKFKNKMEFKFGVVGESILDASGVKELATMPSKEQLIASLLGLIQSGARNLATVINAVPRNLAIVINEGSKKQSA